MNGELAQLCAITAHAKAFLDPKTRPYGSIDPRTHSTFKFVQEQRWVARPRALGLVAQRVVATDPDAWFQHLARGGVDWVQLVASGTRGSGSERVQQSFRGGGTWGIEVGSGSRGAVAHWLPTWRPAADRGSGERPWTVVYRERAGTRVHASRALGEANATLRRTLEGVLAFARELGLTDWVPTFDQALERLESSEPFAPYHPDMLPTAGYELPARRLCAAAQQAWVFGGMGSWNDVVVEDGKTSVLLEQRSDELYRAVVGALLASVEAFSPEAA